MSKIIKAAKINGKNKEINLNSFIIEDENENSSKDSSVPNKAAETEEKLSEAKLKAEKIIKQAEEEAAAIIAQAEAKKAELMAEREELYQEISQKAEEEIRLENEKKIKSLTQNFQQATAEISSSFAKKQKAFKVETVNLAIKIAAMIIDYKNEAEPEMINKIAASIFSQLDETHSNIKVKVNPELTAYLDKSKYLQRDHLDEVELIADPSLKKGDCIVKTNLGGKESIIEHKLELIKKELLKEVKANAGY
ncbi:flagellar biosynthesis protein [Halanaerobium sp. Z-7514]|uniref:Flagellar biosynthesis protein n=1 Tax=Halanaerobium polyolivorans TaxID=2886943 RepID=A0AAW4X078_9FIRM|nr:FliH/SctL family protein [Halanaerobium polyolivorans]MCC3145208.1 flagellar biosynthesis protein [Halanaerobium polyolivorans]